MQKCLKNKKQLLIIIAILTIVVVGFLVASELDLIPVNSKKVSNPAPQTQEVICQSSTENECLFAGCNGFF